MMLKILAMSFAVLGASFICAGGDDGAFERGGKAVDSVVERTKAKFAEAAAKVKEGVSGAATALNEKAATVNADAKARLAIAAEDLKERSAEAKAGLAEGVEAAKVKGGELCGKAKHSVRQEVDKARDKAIDAGAESLKSGASKGKD